MQIVFSRQRHKRNIATQRISNLSSGNSWNALSLVALLSFSYHASAQTLATPCPSRPGSAYPQEGSGACRGNLQIAIPLPTLPFSLIYNSQATRNWGYGMGWSISNDNRFEVTTGTQGFYFSGDGTPIKMIWSTNKWVPEIPALGQFWADNTTSGVLSVSSARGAREHYQMYSTAAFPQQYGGVVSRDRAGNTVWTMTRNASGQITSMKNRFNQVINLSVTTNKLISITDLKGGIYKFYYDASNNLTTVTYPDNLTYDLTYLPSTSLLASVENRDGETTSFTYFTSPTNSALNTVTDYQNMKSTYTYTASDVTLAAFNTEVKESFATTGTSIKRTTVANGLTSAKVYDSSLRLLSKTDAFGNSTSLFYTGTVPFPTSVVKPDGLTANYFYDANNFVITQTLSRAGQSLVTTYDRNTFGDLLAVTTNGVKKTYFYDAVGKLTSSKDTTNTVDFGATYDGNSQLKTVKDQAGNSSIFTFDGIGHLSTATYPSGEVLTYSSNDLGEVSSVTSNFGTSATATYDGVGRVIGNTATVQPLVAGAPEITGKTTTAFDGAGGVVVTNTVTQKVGATTKTVATSQYSYNTRGIMVASAQDGVFIGDTYGLPSVPAPSNLNLSAPMPSQIIATWTGGGGITTGYYLAYAPGTSAPDCRDGGRLGGAATTTATRSDFSPGQTISVSVCAYDAADNISGRISGTIRTPGPASVPTSVTSKAGPFNIGVAWAASAGATSYNIYRGTSPGGEGATPIKTGVTGTSFADFPANFTTYYYKVTAVNTFGESAQSAEVSGAVQKVGYIFVADSGFTKTGTWTLSSVAVPGLYYTSAGTGSNFATYTIPGGALPGYYRIAGNWDANTNHATNAPYTIKDGSTVVGNVAVDQQPLPNDLTDQGTGWKIIFDNQRITSGSMQITVTNNANQYVMAGALRIEYLGPL